MPCMPTSPSGTVLWSALLLTGRETEITHLETGRGGVVRDFSPLPARRRVAAERGASDNDAASSHLLHPGPAEPRARSRRRFFPDVCIDRKSVVPLPISVERVHPAVLVHPAGGSVADDGGVGAGHGAFHIHLQHPADPGWRR